MRMHTFFTFIFVFIFLFSCSDKQQKETNQEKIKIEENAEKKFDNALEEVTYDWETATKEFKNTVYNAYSDKIELYDADGNEVIKTINFPINTEKKQLLLKIMKATLAHNKSEIKKFKSKISKQDLEDEVIRTVMDKNTLIKCQNFITTFEALSVENKKDQQQMLVLIKGLYTQDDIISPRDLSALIQNFVKPKIEGI